MFTIIPNWHPVLVHFSVALLTVAALLHAAVLVVPGTTLRDQLQTVARWNLWIGAVFALLTAASGIYAFNTVAHDTPSHLAMQEHRNWALVTVLLFVVLAAWSWVATRAGKAISGVLAVALLAAGVVLASTAWHGGELVYRHGLGVMSLPKAEDHGDGHAHDHDHGAADEDSANAHEHPADHAHDAAVPPGAPVVPPAAPHDHTTHPH